MWACTALTAPCRSCRGRCRPGWWPPPHVPAGVVEARHGLQRAGHRTHSSGALTWSSRYSLRMPSRPRMTSFTGCIGADPRLRRFAAPAQAGQAGQVGHAVHRARAARPAAPAGCAQRGVVGVDHHGVEEGIHRRLQRGQRLQRRGVVAALEGGVGRGPVTAPAPRPAPLGRLAQQRGLHRRPAPSDFFRMLPTRLLAAASAGASGSAAKARTAARRAGSRPSAAGAARPRRRPPARCSPARAASRPAGRTGSAPPRPAPGRGPRGRRGRPGHQRRHGQRQVALDEHADHAQRVAAQRERVLVAGGQLADAEQAGQRLQLVGQRDSTMPTSPRGSASPAKRGL
jgi:hypothetical protein